MVVACWLMCNNHMAHSKSTNELRYNALSLSFYNDFSVFIHRFFNRIIAIQHRCDSYSLSRWMPSRKRKSLNTWHHRGESENHEGASNFRLHAYGFVWVDNVMFTSNHRNTTTFFRKRTHQLRLQCLRFDETKPSKPSKLIHNW